MASTEAGTGLTERLATFYNGLDYESLSPETVDRAKYFCLDYLSVAIRGAITPSSEAMRRALKPLTHDGDSVVMGTGLRASPEYAALANGTSAHSLEMDDVSNDSSLHPGVATYSTAFACGDLGRVSGRQFITAVTAGYDLMVRLGRALDPQNHYGRGFHPTGTCGTFAAALVASRLMGLDAKETTWALGIAGSQAAGSLEFLAQGAWTKRMHPGWAAHAGIIGALLAREGFLGPTTILEGRDGFLHGYSEEADASKAVESLGDLFYINKVSIKPHSTCRYNQGPIDCILDIVRSHDLKPQEVEKVTVGILKAGFNVVAAPEDKKRNPQNVVDAQFSMPFSAAVAIIHGRASLEEYVDENLGRPEIRDLMSRVHCVQDPALEEDYPSQWPAWAEVETKDGRRLKAEVKYPKGDPENALSWDELKDKFRDITRPVFPEQKLSKQEDIIEMVDGLEELDDVRILARITGI